MKNSFESYFNSGFGKKANQIRLELNLIEDIRQVLGDTNMKIKLIKTKKDYRAALDLVRKLWSRPSKKYADNFELLTILIEAYEKKHFSIEYPDPVEAIKFRMEQQGLRQIDLAKIMGGKNRVSEVLSRKMSLSLRMIKNLHNELKIPYESLIK